MGHVTQVTCNLHWLVILGETALLLGNGNCATHCIWLLTVVGMITQSPSEPLVFLSQDYATDSSVFPRQFWTADWSMSCNKGRDLADNKLLDNLWQTDCGLPSVYWFFFSWPTVSPQLSLNLFTEAGIKSLFLCLVPNNDHSLSPRFLSTSGALSIPTSKFGPAFSLTTSQAEEITSLLISVGYLTVYFCYSIQSIDMHSFPQHCYRVGTNLT